MGIALNLTTYAVAELVARDAAVEPIYAVTVKATFSWRAVPELVEVPSQPIVEVDRYLGDPGLSGLVAAAELGLPKPRVDVLLTGHMRFPSPVEETLVSIDIGSRLTKRMRVVGERRWLPTAGADLAPSRPKAVTELPIVWERSVGGTDPKDSSRSDLRNPAGCTLARTPQDLQGKALPNFEDPHHPLRSWRDSPSPWGFGPIAPHWEQRIRQAGTYDERWRNERAPLLPEDFDRAFLNTAPADQQLADYRPGEEVRLLGMTPQGRTQFRLPHFSIPVLFVMRDLIDERTARVDTIVIEPASERVSLIARAVCSPRPTALSLRQVLVGPLTRGRRRALETGRIFLDFRRLPPRAA